MQDADPQATAESFGIDGIYANYDAVFKDAMSFYKDRALDFFGLPEDMKIQEPLRTEKKEVRVETEFSDFTFRLSDGRGLHAEEEVDLSRDDLLREAVLLIRQMPGENEDRKLKMIALALVVSNKVVSKEELNKIWQEVRAMRLKILEVAEEQGIEQGIVQGIEQGADKERQAFAAFQAQLLQEGLTSDEVLQRVRERLGMAGPAGEVGDQGSAAP